MLRTRALQRLGRSIGPLPTQLAVGVGVAAVAALLRNALVPLVGAEAPFALNFVAVLAATIMAGWRAGVVAIAAGQSFVWFLVMEPRATFELKNTQATLALLMATGAELLLVAILAAYQRRIDTAAEQRESQLRLRDYLVAELKHRVKNTLMVVQALAYQSFESKGSPDLKRFEGRLHALAAAHEILTQREWAGASLREVIRASMAPFDHEAKRVSAEGPDVFLGPNQCVNLTLVFHELATNSIKYGALGSRGGLVRTSWTNDAGQGFQLRWEERGGARVQPPAHRGFGTRMIERAVAAEIGGKAELNFAAEGLVCIIRAPQPLRSELPRTDEMVSERR